MKNYIFFLFFLVLLVGCSPKLIPLSEENLKVLPEGTPIFSDPNIEIQCENAIEILKVKKKERCRVVYDKKSLQQVKVFLGNGDGAITNKDPFFVYCINNEGYYHICPWPEHQDSVAYSAMSTSRKVHPEKFYKLTSGEGARLFFDPKALEKKVIILEGKRGGIIPQKN